MAEVIATAEVSTEPPATNGNGKRTTRIDIILAGMMFFCLFAVLACNWIAAEYKPEGGTWQMLADTRTFFGTIARDILIGFLTLAYPKR